MPLCGQAASEPQESHQEITEVQWGLAKQTTGA